MPVRRRRCALKCKRRAPHPQRMEAQSSREPGDLPPPVVRVRPGSAEARGIAGAPGAGDTSETTFCVSFKGGPFMNPIFLVAALAAQQSPAGADADIVVTAPRPEALRGGKG